jgi:hypothetical protein
LLKITTLPLDMYRFSVDVDVVVVVVVVVGGDGGSSSSNSVHLLKC